MTPQQALAFAIRHCFERESVVPERELKRVAPALRPGRRHPYEVKAELPRHGVLTAEKDGRLMATTEDVHRQERFLTGSPGAAWAASTRSAWPRGWSGASSTTTSGRR